MATSILELVDERNAGCSLQEASALLGITEDAVRKRLKAGTLREVADGQPGPLIDRSQVESDRRELLYKLRAVDQRAHDESERRLRSEIQRLRVAIERMALAARELHSADEAHLDALEQLVHPNVDGNYDLP